MPAKIRTKAIEKRAQELGAAIAADLQELLNVEAENWTAEERLTFHQTSLRRIWMTITMGCVALDCDVPTMLDDFQNAVRIQENASKEYKAKNQIIKVTNH